MNIRYFLLSIFTLTGLLGCEIAQPFDGPNWEGSGEGDEDVWIAATTLDVNQGGDGQTLFDAHMVELTGALESQPGYIGSSLRTTIGGSRQWTLSAWESEEAMMNFVVSDVHLAAMRDFGAISDDGRTTRYTIAADEMPPSWDEALERLSEAETYE